MEDKNAYEKKQQAQLDEWAAELDKLKAKAEQADAEGRIKLNEEIKKAEAMRARVEERLSELRASTDEAWTDLKSGIDNAADSLKNALNSAGSRFA